MPDCEKEYSLFSNQPPSSTNSPLVVALGDSLLQHAVPKTQWLNGNTRWYRVNIGAGQKNNLLHSYQSRKGETKTLSARQYFI